jgi:hypothetical protein
MKKVTENAAMIRLLQFRRPIGGLTCLMAKYLCDSTRPDPEAATLSTTIATPDIARYQTLAGFRGIRKIL